MVEVGRSQGKRDKGWKVDAWQIPSEQFYFIYLAIKVILFLFICELFIIDFFVV